MAYKQRSRDEHFKDAGPKRILALDGGGLRGIVTLAYLARIEDLLRARFGGAASFRLGHYFDLIAGTSTGAIIAAALARGLSVAEITKHYLNMGRDVFKSASWKDLKRRFAGGVLVPKYTKTELEELLKTVLGAKTTLGSPDLITGLLIVTKRTDTGSPWPLGNNPDGKYFRAPPGASWISNADYPLWQVVRASTAAPTYFEPEPISIGAGAKGQIGNFVDGGVSPFNNPALQAFMYATIGGYGVRWKAGADNLLIVSIGTGTDSPENKNAKRTAVDGVKALSGLMDDSASLVETLMQWMSESPTARRIDGEIGTLSGDLLGGAPQFQYVRYNVLLTRDGLTTLATFTSDAELESLAQMDKPQNLERLKAIGEIAAAHHVNPGHFPPQFDIA